MNEDNSIGKETFERRLNRETRPPNGQRLNLHSLRFAEVIKISEVENLQKGFDRFFEERLHVKNALLFSSDQDNYRNFIAQSRKVFLSMHSMYLQGFASKAYADRHKEGVITRPVRELPIGVDSISFFLYQMIPSSVIVVTQVEFDDSISDSLNKLFNAEYMELTEKHEDGTMSIFYPDRVKSLAIQDSLSRLQVMTESFVSKYFSGIFISEITEVQIKCPSLKFFSLQDIPFSSSEALIKWMQDNRFFIDMLGYAAVPSWTYQFNNEYLLFKDTSYQRKEKPMYVSILTSESLFNTPGSYDGYGTPIWAVKHKHCYEFDSLMPLLAVGYLLQWHSRKLLTYRNSLDSDDKVTLGIDLRKQYDSAYIAKAKINNDYFDFIRLRQELGEVISERFEPRLYNETPMFELVKNQNNLPHFAKELVAVGNFLSDSIAKEYALLNERYSDLFETMNTQSNFILNESNAKYQKSLATLTWVLVVLTVMMLIAVVVQIVIAICSLPPPDP
ncbi:MAG: hypothetical protein AAB116_04135 [Candidatus Poribacteria bacterium]